MVQALKGIAISIRKVIFVQEITFIYCCFFGTVVQWIE